MCACTTKRERERERERRRKEGRTAREQWQRPLNDDPSFLLTHSPFFLTFRYSRVGSAWVQLVLDSVLSSRE
jgi:hypothetical protein